MAGIFSSAGEIVTRTLYVGGGSKGVFGDLYGLLVYISAFRLLWAAPGLAARSLNVACIFVRPGKKE